MPKAFVQGAAETHTGNVRDHNEDAHVVDGWRGIFAVFDGMGGHSGGEVASALAAATISDRWANEATQRAIKTWLELGTCAARKALIDVAAAGVRAAHEKLLTEAKADTSKQGMGTTVVGALMVGSEVMIAYCGDSRAYLVRDGRATQLTEDHTLLQRLLSAGIDVDLAHDGSRWNSVLTNALGLEQKFRVVVAFAPIADGDRLLLCSDGITQYVQHEEIASLVEKTSSPSAAANRLVDIALARGGSDNATALVMNVVDAGAPGRSAASLQRDQNAMAACPLWGKKVSLQEQLRALRMTWPRSIAAGGALPVQDANDRIAWIVLDGHVEQGGRVCGPGALLYPEALVASRPLPTADAWWVAQDEVRALALRECDFRDVCDEEPELGEKLLASLGAVIAEQPSRAIASASIGVVPSGSRTNFARSSRPPEDQRGFGHDLAAESPLARALAAFAEEQAEPEISVEPWLDHALAEAAGDSDRDPSQPIEIIRERLLPKDHG